MKKILLVLISMFLFSFSAIGLAQEEYADTIVEELSAEELEIIQNLDFLDSLDFLESQEELAFLDDYQDVNDFEE
jgi:hypothetical protein